MTLEARARDLWTIDHPLRVGGLALGTRTSVLRLADGSLLLHSPGPLTDHAAAIRELGEVRAIVAPNALHHLYLAEARALFENARTWISPRVADKQRDLSGALDLGAETPPEWGAGVTSIPVAGLPGVQEFALVHASSRTLLLADLAFNMRSSSSWFTRGFMRLNGGWQRFGPTRLMRAQIKDRDALRASCARILEHDFDRIVVAHGDIVDKDGREAFRRAFESI